MSNNLSLGEAILDLVADGTGLVDDINANKKSVLGAMSGLGSAGGAILGTALAATAAVGGFLVSSIGPASDLNETISKTNVIFGDSSKEILAWSETAATAMGMSQKAALDAVASFGTFGKGAGLAGDDLTKFVTTNATLAGDLASFWNTSTEEAQTAIQAAFRGETEPIRKFGVMLDDASLRNKAFSMGIIKSTKEALTPQQKVLAVNALLWEQTGDAQGDFARTSDGLANKQRILGAQFENIRAQLGTALLPAVQKIAKAFSDFLGQKSTQTFLADATKAIGDFAAKVIENIPTVITWFQNFGTWLSNNQGVVVAVLAVIGASLIAFGVSAAVAGITAMAGLWPIVLLIAVIGLVAYELYQAWTQDWWGMRTILQGFWAWLQPILQKLWDWLAENIPKALRKMKDVWTFEVKPVFNAIWAWMVNNLFPVFKSLGDFLGTVFNVVVTAMAGIWQNVLWPALKKVGEWIKTNLGPAFKEISDWWTKVGQPVAKGIADWFGNYVVRAFEALANNLKAVAKWISDVATQLKNIKLPKWMTPGSPTPWEIGLWGVQDALKAVSHVGLPQLSVGMGSMGAPALATAGVSSGISGGSAPAFVYAPTLSTGNEHEMQQALNKYFDVRSRELSKR